jgi:HSP20 family protein
MALPAVRSLNSLGRWDPFRDFDGLFTQISRNTVWAPLTDVTETDSAYVLELEVPGVRREDVTVDLNGTSLSVTGELKDVEREGVTHRKARRTGKFAYRVTLPRTVDADNIEAKLVDGVLTVSVPKLEVAKPRRIEITA